MLTPLRNHIAAFLARKVREAYVAQRRTTRYMASITELAGPQKVLQWLAIKVDDKAPTPLTFREKVKNSSSSVYVLHRAEGRELLSASTVNQ